MQIKIEQLPNTFKTVFIVEKDGDDSLRIPGDFVYDMDYLGVDWEEELRVLVKNSEYNITTDELEELIDYVRTKSPL